MDPLDCDFVISEVLTDFFLKNSRWKIVKSKLIENLKTNIYHAALEHGNLLQIQIGYGVTTSEMSEIFYQIFFLLLPLTVLEHTEDTVINTRKGKAPNEFQLS